MLPQYKPDAVLEQFERHAVTVFAGGPPTIYIGLLASPKFDSTNFSALKYCMGGGAPFPGDLLREWERRTDCALLENSGMSEGAPLSGNLTHGKRKLMSVGVVPPETEIDIVDIETGTKVLPIMERGEVRVKGPQFTRGYRNRPEETDLGRKIVDLITRPGEARDRLSQQAYTTLGPGNPLGLLQEALELSEQMAPLERKLKQSQKEGLIRSEYLGHQIDEAERAEIISKTEAKNLRSYHQKVLDLLAVDDFAPDEIGRAGARSKAAPQKPVAKKAAARKKAAKKKTSSKKKIAKKPSG